MLIDDYTFAVLFFAFHIVVPTVIAFALFLLKGPRSPK
jgi:hypothetical protein